MKTFLKTRQTLLLAALFFCGSLQAAPFVLAAAQAEAAPVINLNQADAAALESIRGIGPALAGRIIEYREQNGPFQTLDQLKAVKGIGDAKFEKIKNQLSL